MCPFFIVCGKLPDFFCNQVASPLQFFQQKRRAELRHRAAVSYTHLPFLADKVKAKGIFYDNNPNNLLRQCDKAYYITPAGYIYSNRLALLIEKAGVLDGVKHRLEKYFDEFIIDEIQDIAGRDFSFLENLMKANINMLFVGDFYQHTYDTSRDGNTNKNLFSNFSDYESRFINKGFLSDKTSLVKSWRCSPSICRFITENLGIKIYSCLLYTSRCV